MSAGNGKWEPRPGHIPGVAVNLGGHDLVVAPLGLRPLREFEERSKKLAADGASAEDYYNLNIDALLISLQRNYPDMTRDALEALLDSGNIKEAINGLLDTSGLKRVKPGELQTAAGSTGMTSTPS